MFVADPGCSARRCETLSKTGRAYCPRHAGLHFTGERLCPVRGNRLPSILIHSMSGINEVESAGTSGMKKVPRANNTIVDQLGCRSWGTWGCEVSVFPWTYDDDEICWVLQGDVIVTCKATGDTMRVQAGDVAFFPKGMSCTWNVSSPIRKHFCFGRQLA
mmetsp:Transcript_16559/g.33883  ORF Transcript_16559/g.33883 Transcript_16559/m.33883 type:complete len:160 (+) Transcript_16559:198-677(+)